MKDMTFPMFCPNCGIRFFRPDETDDYYTDFRILPMTDEEYNRFQCASCKKKFCYHEHK